MTARTGVASSFVLRSLATCSVLLGVGAPTTVHADETSAPAVLEWLAPEGCTSQAAVNSEIFRLAEQQAATTARLRFTASASVKRTTEGTYRALISTTEEGRTGTRELDAATCEELAGMTALLLAMMLRPASPAPEGGPDEDQRQQPLAPKEEHRETEQPAALPPAPRTRDEASALRLLLGVTAAGHTGLIGGPWCALGPVLGVRLGETRLQASALYSPSTVARAPADARAEAELEALSVGGSACAAASYRRIPIGACLSVEWQRLIGQGTAPNELFESSRRTVDFLTVGGGPLLIVPLGKRFALPVRIEALVPLRRPAFVFDGLGIVAQPAAVWARASVTSELSLF
jgi:hypothetical protein